jgi:serine/threonine protein kinase
MQPDRWKTIEETFHAVSQLPPEERVAYLDKVCRTDSDLRREVESLLESSKTDSVMDRPVAGMSLAAMEERSLEGRKLNHYDIKEKVDSGGMADIYRAWDNDLKRDVAVKVVRDAQFLGSERLQRMYREAQLLARLKHTNIGAIYGIEEEDGVCGLALEFIEGETLSQRIARSPLPVREALEIARQIASGLRAAHAEGIIHRDLKPSNIKITPDGVVKIIDFGIAKLLHPPAAGSVTDLSRQGQIVGTTAYMAPEQARGKAIDVRTDIWAFGCVLYEMLSGRSAFQGDTPTDIIIKIATEDPDWNVIPRLPESISQPLGRLIRTCLEKDRDRRYRSVEDLIADLDNIHETQPRSRLPDRRPESGGGDDFVLPVRSAPAIFLLTQFGYMALYAATMYHLEKVAAILETDFQIPSLAGTLLVAILALCGVAIRLYLISAVGWRHPEAGRKFSLLFPALLVFDGIWAAAPLLLEGGPIRLGPLLVGVALLAYVPFAQRTLIRTIYPKHSLRNDTKH